MKNMLAIDTGYRNVGIAVIEIATGKIIDTATITTGKLPFYEAIAEVTGWIGQTIEEMDIEIIVYENVFGRGKVREVSGTIIKTGIDRGITKFCKYSPGHMKKVITGNGRAKKEEIEKVLQEKYDIDTSNMTDHETDAIGHGITYLLDNANQITEQLAKEEGVNLEK